MKQILNSIIVEDLEYKNSLLKIISWDYLTDENDVNFKHIAESLYPWRPLITPKLLSPWCYVWTILNTWEKSFFWVPQVWYTVDWGELIDYIEATWDVALKINVDKIQLESIKADNYYTDWTTEYFIYLFEKLSDTVWKTQKYIMLETFSNKIFTRKLFKIPWYNSVAWGDEVDLTELEETKDLKANLFIDLPKLVLARKTWYKILESLISLTYSLDRKLAHNDYVGLNYGEPWTVLKWIDILNEHRVNPNDPNSPVDFKKLWKLVVWERWENAGVEIVKNTYDNIEANLKIVEKQFLQVSAITWIPTWAFSDTWTNSSNSGVAKDKQATIFYKRIELYQYLIWEIFAEFWELTKAPESERVLEFTEVVTTSTSELLDIEEKKLNNWLTSKLRAIMKANWITKEEAQIILEEIRQENNLNLNDNDKILTNTTTS